MSASSGRAVLALLVGFLAWTGGFVTVRLATDSPLAARLGTVVCFAGVMLVAPIWLLVCARVARINAVAEQPRAFLIALLVPTFINFVAMATDPLHGLFANGTGRLRVRGCGLRGAGDGAGEG